MSNFDQHTKQSLITDKVLGWQRVEFEIDVLDMNSPFIVKHNHHQYNGFNM